ncbi:MAG: sugar ABC transporter permease [Blautia hansenii]|nr:sugar ABC transporter permease [Blautia hansenii]MEE0655844.1 sugar ABC transporter permease [Blautia hansenii]
MFSFTDWSIYSFETPHFIGLSNFKDLFASQSFLPALGHTFLFALITTILKVGLGLIFALLLNAKFKGKNFFRAVIFLPCTIGALVIGYVFTFILQPDTGILNEFLRMIGLDSLALNWLGDTKIVLYVVCAVESWMWIGFNTAIILAGLQSISGDVYEAAKIDGASGWQTIKSITLPLVVPSVNTTITLCVIGGFNIFDIVMSMTNGGPNGATQVISKLSYDAMRVGTLGYASAINLIQFLLIVIVISPLLNFLKRKEPDI